MFEVVPDLSEFYLPAKTYTFEHIDYMGLILS